MCRTHSRNTGDVSPLKALTMAAEANVDQYFEGLLQHLQQAKEVLETDSCVLWDTHTDQDYVTEFYEPDAEESMYWSPVAIDVTPLSAKDVDTCLNQLEVDLARDTTDHTAQDIGLTDTEAAWNLSSVLKEELPESPQSVTDRQVTCRHRLDVDALVKSTEVDFHCPPAKHSNRSRKQRSTTKKQVQIWQFILETLGDSRYNPRLIMWVDQQEGIFKFVQSEKVAQLWNAKRGGSATYPHFSRSVRHYYRKGIMSRITGQRLVYKFGPMAAGWRSVAAVTS